MMLLANRVNRCDKMWIIIDYVAYVCGYVIYVIDEETLFSMSKRFC